MPFSAKGHFWLCFYLFVETSLKSIFLLKVLYEALFWNRGSTQLGNWVSTILVARWLAIKGVGPTAELGSTLMNVVLTVLWTVPWGRAASEMLNLNLRVSYLTIPSSSRGTVRWETLGTRLWNTKRARQNVRHLPFHNRAAKVISCPLILSTAVSKETVVLHAPMGSIH